MGTNAWKGMVITMKYGCIGEHLSHSFSSEIHGLTGREDYILKELSKDEFPSFFAKKDFLGINVTIPYKCAVMPYLDEIDAYAARIGAVNTVVNRGGKLFGYNTDICGISALMDRNGISVSGKKVLILGSGGTSLTAYRAVKDAARCAFRVSRSGACGTVSYPEAKEIHPDAEIIINTTPCGMYPDIFASPIELSAFDGLVGVADVIYNPIKTELVLEAEARGVNACSGLYMLVYQAVASEALFDGKEFSLKNDSISADSDLIYKKIVSEKRNIVLCGMPSCGKSTVGRLISEITKKPFIDTDEEIEKKCQKSISEIFKEVGEAGFRKIEAEVIRGISNDTGRIIALGGGAVLDPENVKALKHNGVIVFIDRALSELTPCASRPLFRDEEVVLRLHKERYGIYSSVSDITVRSENSSARGIAEKIIKLSENYE